MPSIVINNTTIEFRLNDRTFGECVNFMKVQHGMNDTDIAKRMGISTKRLGELCERSADPNNKRRQDAVSADESLHFTTIFTLFQVFLNNLFNEVEALFFACFFALNICHNWYVYILKIELQK